MQTVGGDMVAFRPAMLGTLCGSLVNLDSFCYSQMCLLTFVGVLLMCLERPSFLSQDLCFNGSVVQLSPLSPLSPKVPW